MRLKLAISPCPNDTFAFEALLANRMAGCPFSFDYQLLDIQALNQLALAQGADVVKVSFFAWPMLRQHYHLLDSGAALGYGVGPLLVAAKEPPVALTSDLTVAIPGWNTTAHLLLHYFAPQLQHKIEMRFDEIMPAVASGAAHLGVVIHEGRFTYKKFGLELVQDLGEYWETKQNQPIPLGGIVARNTLGPAILEDLGLWLARSIRHAWLHPKAAMPFVRAHAQEMDEAVMQSHIQLYVTERTESLGPEGLAAIEKLARLAESLPPHRA